MIARKPVSGSPYSSPKSESKKPPVPRKPGEVDPGANDSDPDSDNIWGEDDDEEDEASAPTQAHAHQDQQHPPAPSQSGATFLRMEDDEDNVWAEARNQSAPSSSQTQDHPDVLRPGGNTQTNPFLRKKIPEIKTTAPTPDETPVELPADEPFSNLSLNESSNNPWQPALDAHQESPSPTVSYTQPLPDYQPPPGPPPPNIAAQDPWADTFDKPSRPPPPPPSHAPPAAPSPAAPSPALISLGSEEEESGWDDERRSKRGKSPERPPMTAMSDEFVEEQNVWDDLGSLGKGKSQGPGAFTGQSPPLDDWNLIDANGDAEPSSSQSKEPAAKQQQPEGKPPLPTRPRWVPTREPVDGSSETYQVKNIRWHDPTAANNPRSSPILVQNANGPCPLVALVNALTLTTPPEMNDTALVNILRSREQVSLNLLLDAVFDELMSPRRLDEDITLPDVGDLYSFLQSLHTGMNVNPRFIPTQQMINAFNRTSLTHLHPAERAELIPGTFENTQEMGLYATFSIPLIHGWLPSRDEPAYAALERQAASYEDVQNLLFREEELESRLLNPHATLSEQEQLLYQDILTIKSFLSISATQLTQFGIGVIGKAIRPGTFAILFRNDHFSTLYCHPVTMALLTLVTDAGYKGHEEIVWESLVDVNGERSELLSGDYRPVGPGTGAGSSSGAGPSTGDGGGDWTTVQNTRGKGREESFHSQNDAPVNVVDHEQEDRDLALALQLQEEEDHRHREEEARRKRERELSEQFIEQQARQPETTATGGSSAARGGAATRGGTAPRGGRVSDLVPGRRSSNSVNVPATTTSSNTPSPRTSSPSQFRPQIPPRRQTVRNTNADDPDDAPPSYEESAHDLAYVPPLGHPAHETTTSSSAEASRVASRTSVNMGNSYRSGRRQASVSTAAAQQQARNDRECVVM